MEGLAQKRALLKDALAGKLTSQQVRERLTGSQFAGYAIRLSTDLYQVGFGSSARQYSEAEYKQHQDRYPCMLVFE